MRSLIDLKRECDAAALELVAAAQMNVADCVPIEQRIEADRAFMAARRRMAKAHTEYQDALAAEVYVSGCQHTPCRNATTQRMVCLACGADLGASPGRGGMIAPTPADVNP